VKARTAMAIGLAAVAVILAAVLLQRDQRRSGSNLVHSGPFVAVLGHGQSACQGDELLPDDTSAVRLTIGTFNRPGPSLRVVFSGARGEQLAAGSLGGGWRQGVVQIPITHVTRPIPGAYVCLSDLGPGTIEITGSAPDPPFQMSVAGSTVGGRLRYDYMRPGRESWLELLPTIVYRSTFAKSGVIRHWAWAAALVLMALAVGLAARTIAGAERS
jgi:hypothetical protein